MSRLTDYATFFNLMGRTRTHVVECVKITRTDGTIYRFTAHDEPITIKESGTEYNYVPSDGFDLTNLEMTIGMSVSNMDLRLVITDDTISETDIMYGLFENAQVELFLAYWGARRDVETLPLRTSWIGEINLSDLSFNVDLRGLAQKLQELFLDQTSLECRYTEFGGTECGVNLAALTHTGTITAVESRDIFTIGALDAGQYDNYYQWGSCTFTSGDNNGKSMEIMRQYQTRFQLFVPMPYDIEVGDTVTIVAGCNRSYDDCVAFGNLDRFGGEPLLKTEDTLADYPQRRSTVDT